MNQVSGQSPEQEQLQVSDKLFTTLSSDHG